MLHRLDPFLFYFRKNQNECWYLGSPNQKHAPSTLLSFRLLAGGTFVCIVSVLGCWHSHEIVFCAFKYPLRQPPATVNILPELGMSFP